MTNNMRLFLLVSGLVLLHILNISSDGVFRFFGVLVIISAVVLLLRRFPVIVKTLVPEGTMNAFQRNHYLNELEKEQRRKPVSYVLGALAALYLARFTLGSAGFTFFSFFENTFRFADTLTPAFSWALFGLLVGAAAGAYAAGRKYNLSAAHRLTPTVLLLVLIVISAMINKPFSVVAPLVQMEALKADSVSPQKTVQPPAPHVRKRRHKNRHVVYSPIDSTKISAAEPGSTEKENEERAAGADTSRQVIHP